MATTTAGGYLARVWTIVPDARTAKHAYSARNNKRDTIDDARRKTAEKLRENKSYVLDKANVEKPDLVYKQQADGRYSVSAKYGNRWLDGAFDGESYIADVSEEKLPAMLEMLACDTESCMFDVQIEVIRQANIAAKSKG
jgi:hypothetical protein